MKILKIILPIVTIALIGFFVFKSSIDSTSPPPVIDVSETGADKEMVKLLDSLNNYPTNMFCHEFYKEIQSAINNYYKGDVLSLADSTNLSRDLYSVYATKFVQQAKDVLQRSDWKNGDLTFIRSELEELSGSVYLDPSSPVADEFNSLNKALNKYYEITSFISLCNSFSYTNYSMNDKFPDVSHKIDKSSNYLLRNLDNTYVNNCTRLKEGLKKIPKILYDKHIEFLSTKIIQNSNRFAEFETQPDYNYAIFEPIMNEIQEIDRKLYGITSADHSKNKTNLIDVLSKDNTKAYAYFFGGK